MIAVRLINSTRRDPAAALPGPRCLCRRRGLSEGGVLQAQTTCARVRGRAGTGWWFYSVGDVDPVSPRRAGRRNSVSRRRQRREGKVRTCSGWPLRWPSTARGWSAALHGTQGRVPGRMRPRPCSSGTRPLAGVPRGIFVLNLPHL